MNADPIWKRLLPWMNEPTVMRVVLDTIEKAERPMTCGEVARMTGISLHRASETLRRLVHKGLAERWKAPVHHGGEQAGFCQGGWTRNQWLYAVPRAADVDNGDRQ